jgi:hypothetical protein
MVIYAYRKGKNKKTIIKKEKKMEYKDVKIAFKIIEDIYYDIYYGENPSNARDFIHELIDTVEKYLL